MAGGPAAAGAVTSPRNPRFQTISPGKDFWERERKREQERERERERARERERERRGEASKDWEKNES